MGDTKKPAANAANEKPEAKAPVSTAQNAIKLNVEANSQLVMDLIVRNFYVKTDTRKGSINCTRYTKGAEAKLQILGNSIITTDANGMPTVTATKEFDVKQFDL